MSGDLLNKYVWFIDLLTRYGRLTRREINEHWMSAAFSDGKPIAERSFFHIRRIIEENFGIEIGCNNYHEYFIKNNSTFNNKAFTNWLLDAYAVRGAIKSTPEVIDRVVVEEVPSARQFLAPVLEAIRSSRQIIFSYAGFNRSRKQQGICYSPYFVKLYKQRWYMVGMNETIKEIRTYALDRIVELSSSEKTFEMPEDLVPSKFFSNIIGITTSKAPVREVRLRVTPEQAKYFRMLPFHESQKEELVDDGGYIVFTYKLKLNYELVHEILSYGSQVKVEQPYELQLMVKEELDKMNSYYDNLK